MIPACENNLFVFSALLNESIGVGIFNDDATSYRLLTIITEEQHTVFIRWEYLPKGGSDKWIHCAYYCLMACKQNFISLYKKYTKKTKHISV